MPVIRGKQIADGAKAVLLEVMQKSNVDSLEVTSVQRDANRQAIAMFDLAQAKGIDKAKALYKLPGQLVIQVYAENHAILTRDEVITLMEAKIKAVGESNVSKHCLGPGAPIWVIDIGPSSIPDDKEDDFIEQCKRHPRISKVLSPKDHGGELAIHVEIEKEEQKGVIS